MTKAPPEARSVTTMDAKPPFELGLYTFGDIAPDSERGTITPAARLRDVIEEARLADEVGLDVFGVGEHHRADFPISAPAVVLAAIAERTKRIRLTSAVNVLSSDDPVRVFQAFSTVDPVRTEVSPILGRPSFRCRLTSSTPFMIISKDRRFPRIVLWVSASGASSEMFTESTPVRTSRLTFSGLRKCPFVFT